MSGFKAYLLPILLVFVATGPALATDALDFNGQTSQREKALLGQYAASHLKQPLETLSLARPDLNGDGMGEYVLRPECAKICTFTILAEKKDEIIELGMIEARELRLGNAYTGSVRNIIAFKDAINDYERTVYVWEPKSARYMMKE